MDIETLETMPLGELEETVHNLRGELEDLIHVVSEQEQELETQVQTVEELQSKIAAARENELPEIKEKIGARLAEQQEKNKMLEKTLVGQYRTLHKRETLFKQQLRVLLQRKGMLNAEDHHQNELEILLALSEQAEKPSTKTATASLTAKWRQWLIPVGIGILVAVGVNSLLKITSATQPTTNIPTPTRNTQPEVVAVTALGRIEPQGEVIKVSAPSALGDANVSELLVKEGEQVKQGQIIAILEEQKRRLAAVERAEKEVQVARADLNIVNAGAKTGEIQAQEATVARLEAQLTGEKIAKEAFISRLEAQLAREQQAQQATIARLESESNNAQVEYQRYQQLTAEGAISQSELDRRRTQLETARESVKEAKANLERITDTLTQQIREARAVYQQTLSTLEKQIEEAKANLARIAEVRDVDVQKVQAEVEKAMANLKEAEADLDLSYVKAPSNGQVLKIHTYPGESVNTREGIVELGKTEQMMVIAEVYESDIGKVQVGQPAIMTSESGAFSEELRGTVSEIGLQVGKKDVLDSDPAADVDVRVIEVKIKLDRDSSQRVAGLTYAKVIAKIVI